MKLYFSKLLTEQERAGSRNPSRKWGKRIQLQDADSEYENEVVGKAKMCRRNRQCAGGDYNWKELTDVLSPLYGYLEKNVGRHWDDVYSELCQNLDRRSVSGQHVFTHLWQYVDKDTAMCEDGKVRVRSSYCGFTDPDDFYIHPYTGILCEAEHRRWSYRAFSKRKRKDLEVIEIPIRVCADGLNGESYQRIDGIWYQCEWTKVDTFARIKQQFQVLKKRQLGKKELKHLGLSNRMPVMQG